MQENFAKLYKEKCDKGYKGIVFAVDIQHAEYLKRSFLKYGFTVDTIHTKKTNNGLKWEDYIDEQLKSYSELQNVQLATLQSLIDELLGGASIAGEEQVRLVLL